MDDPLAPNPIKQWLPRLALAALMVPVLVPFVVQFTPEPYFDVDPRGESGQVLATALGPSGTAWLSVYAVAAAAFAMGVFGWRGGRVHWVSVALIATGMAFAAWHMTRSYANLIQTGPWVAAAAVALGLYHLGQLPGGRRYLLPGAGAMLVAILIPVAIQAIYFIAVEHPMTVEQFRLNEAGFLQSRGWVAGSPQHELYVRRLESADAIGAFGLSNVLGSVVAALTMLGVGWAVALCLRLAGAAKPPVGVEGAPSVHPPNESSGRNAWVALPLALIVLGLITLWLTHSKGATAGLAAGGIVFGVGSLLIRNGWPRWLPPTIAVALLVAAIAVVIFRGAVIGPPPPEVGIEGERSLLFRYQYWQGAADIWGTHGQAMIAGIGPADFKTAYVAVKSPLSPEEVTSAHSVFIDLPTMLGLGGIAWCAVLLTWLWRSGSRLDEDERPRATIQRSGQFPGAGTDLAGIIAVAAVVFGLQYRVNFDTLFIDTVLLWLLGLLGFIFAAAMLSRRRIDRRWVNLGLFAAAAVVLIHNQIEMSFYQASSAFVVWGVVGLAGGGSMGATDKAARGLVRADSSKALMYLPCLGLAAVMIAMLIGYAAPVTAFTSRQAEARLALIAGQPLAAIEALDTAGMAEPSDRTVLRWRVQMRLEWAGALRQNNQPGKARAVIDQALDILAAAPADAVGRASLERLTASVHETAAGILGEPDRLAQASAALERVLDYSPTSLPDTLRLADLYWEMGQTEKAAPLYARAIALSEMSYLDPAKGLNEAQMKRARSRSGS